MMIRWLLGQASNLVIAAQAYRLYPPLYPLFLTHITGIVNDKAPALGNRK
jgi:hypothetical protein